MTCLPACLHNRPERIAEAVRARIRQTAPRYDEILCLYGDCGTGGELDRVLREEGVARIDGRALLRLLRRARKPSRRSRRGKPGTFYLTDFLARHFETLVVKGLGLDRFPAAARTTISAHYSRLRRHLAQFDDPEIDRAGGGGGRSGSASPSSAALPVSRASLDSSRRMPRRRGGDAMASLSIVYWRDIPSQVIVRQGRRSARRELPERFISAIDAAAMRAGAASTDAYLADWRRGEPAACGDDIEAEADAAAARLEAEYDKQRLARLLASQGREDEP